MRYWRVSYPGPDGNPTFSDPLPTWVAAYYYALLIGPDAVILTYR